MALPERLPNGFEMGRIVTVHQGDCQVSDQSNVTLSTVLGSCVAACVRDTVANVGGMNHFLLSEQSEIARDQFGASARYGAYAMEQLINSVLKAGTGRKGNLQIKVFGGGNINSRLTDIGAANATFVRKFLSQEGYSIAGEDLGGPYARRVLFNPVTGRTLVKRLDSDIGAVVKTELETARKTPVAQPQDDDIELF